MIQTSTFYEKRLGAHSFLCRPGSQHCAGALQAADDAIRDIEFAALRKKRLESLNDADLPALRSSGNGADQTVFEDKADKKRAVANNRVSLHTRKYTVRSNDVTTTITEKAAAPEDIPVATYQKDREDADEERASGAGEPRKMTNKVACVINYKSPAELHSALRAQVQGQTYRNVTDINAGETRCVPAYDTFDESVEDAQLRSLDRLRLGRAHQATCNIFL